MPPKKDSDPTVMICEKCFMVLLTEPSLSQDKKHVEIICQDCGHMNTVKDSIVVFTNVGQ